MPAIRAKSARARERRREIPSRFNAMRVIHGTPMIRPRCRRLGSFIASANYDPPHKSGERASAREYTKRVARWRLHACLDINPVIRRRDTSARVRRNYHPGLIFRSFNGTIAQLLARGSYVPAAYARDTQARPCTYVYTCVRLYQSPLRERTATMCLPDWLVARKLRATVCIASLMKRIALSRRR